MARNPDMTIIRVGSVKIWRGDFAGSSNTPLAVQVVRRAEAGDSLPDAVRAILDTDGRPARRVVVFADEVWSQSLTLPSAQVRQLPKDDLARALAFEAEPFSNIPPGEAAVGFRHTATRTHINSYAVVICPQDEICDLRDVVKNAGGRLWGVSHPDVISVDQAVGKRFTTDCQQEHAEAYEWLSAWRDALTKGNQEMVFIVPPSSIPLRQRQIMAGALYGGILTVLCMAHWLQSASLHTALQEQLTEVQRESDRISAVESSNASLRRQLDEIRKLAEAKRIAVERLAAARGTLPRLLRSIAEHRPNDVVVRNIHDRGEGLHGIEGLAMTARGVDRYASQLSDALSDAGLSVAITTKTARGELADGGPWRFELEIAASESLIHRSTTPASQPIRRPQHARFQ
jgi:hypothetical protein